jgi:hypothetical protein
MNELMPQYKQLAGLILEGKTFDLKEDTDALGSVWEVMVAYFRKDWPNKPKYIDIETAGESYQMHFTAAKKYLAEEGTPVYVCKKIRDDGGLSTKNEFITIDPSYRNAKENDYDRILNRAGHCVNSTNNEIVSKHPERSFEFKSETTKRLTE